MLQSREGSLRVPRRPPRPSPGQLVSVVSVATFPTELARSHVCFGGVVLAERRNASSTVETSRHLLRQQHATHKMSQLRRRRKPNPFAVISIIFVIVLVALVDATRALDAAVASVRLRAGAPPRVGGRALPLLSWLPCYCGRTSLRCSWRATKNSDVSLCTPSFVIARNGCQKVSRAPLASVLHAASSSP